MSFNAIAFKIILHENIQFTLRGTYWYVSCYIGTHLAILVLILLYWYLSCYVRVIRIDVLHENIHITLRGTHCILPGTYLGIFEPYAFESYA